MNQMNNEDKFQVTAACDVLINPSVTIYDYTS